ncbi:MAG TPA: DUF6785 family protein [Capsulimonadaceae bacterium]|jgi:hypothetical protein
MPTAEPVDSADVQPNTARGDTPAPPAFRWPLLLLIGWPLTALSFYLVVRMEQIDRIGLPTGLAIYYHVVVMFAALLLANWLYARWSRGRVAASPGELLCLYSMMNIGACFASWESYGTLIPSLAYPAYAVESSPLNAWLKPVIAAMPAWAIVKDPVAATAIFQGGHSLAVWRGWFVPLLAWGGLLATLFLMFLTLTRLLWESWTHDEKLSFPLTALPIQMTEPGAKLWRTPLFWAGATVAGVLDLVNGLHQVIPAVPSIFTKVNYLSFNAADPAWRAVDNVPLTIHPLMFGIAYLLRTDLLFSTWFFFLVGKVQLYIAGIYGIAHGSPYVFLGNAPGLLAQNFGAMLILVGAMLYNSRRMWARQSRLARSGDREAIGQYALLLGGSAVLLFAFSQLGIAVWLGALSLLIIFVLAVFVTRLRAELGLPVHNMQFLGPDGPLVGIFNGNLLTAQSQNGFGALFALTRSLQGHPMPHIMEAASMADHARSMSRRFWGVIGATGILCVMLGPWLFVWMASARGLELSTGMYQFLCAEGWKRIQGFTMSPHLPDMGAITEMGAGAAITLLLLAVGRAWIGSPFHPVGYAISGSWGTGYVWLPFLFAWLVKTLTLKYGGAAAYRKGVSFALGLILGEFAVGTLWTLFSFLTGAQGYRIWLF